MKAVDESIAQALRPRLPRAVGWPSPLVNKWMRDRVRDAGGDPSLVPDEPFRFLRLREVEKRVGLARSTLYRKIAEGSFPAPLILGARSGDATGRAA